MQDVTMRWIAVALMLTVLSGTAVGQGASPAVAPDRTVVLDTTSTWRLHSTLKSPVIQSAGRGRPLATDWHWLDCETPPPPADWREPEFDDSTWQRGLARMGPRTPYLARLCMRGKFTVTDPAKVRGLSLSVGYHGGAIVYVNGKEIARSHVPADARDGTLADAYPVEAFVAGDGKLITWDRRKPRPEGETGRRLSLRRRTLADVAVPGALLRRGVNVLEIEIVRTAYPEAVAAKGDPQKAKIPYDLRWFTCQILDVGLTADSAAGLVPNVVRPAGLQAWNNDLLTGDFDQDYGDPNEPLRPVALVGVQNGSATGKVVLGSTRPVRGLRVSVSDFRSAAGAAVPASAVRIRYAAPWGREWLADEWYLPSPFPARETLLGRLLESPMEEVPLNQPRARRGHAAPVPGAVVPIWMTVSVPADARPGSYEGRATISAKDENPIRVPVHLTVEAWKMPDPHDYGTWVGMIQSPDALALEYGVELWSDRHFKLIAKSFAFLGEVGCRVVYVPLICYTNCGNAESMVRWIDKGDGRYEYDFSIVGRYLDTAEQHMGKPAIVAFLVWDVLLLPKMEDRNAKDQPRAVRWVNRVKDRKAAPTVTVVDPVTRKAEPVTLPVYANRSSEGLWTPLFAELRRCMRKRGLEDAMMMGFITDGQPSRGEFAFLKKASSGLPWVSHAHHATSPGVADIGYQACVFSVTWPGDPGVDPTTRGWMRPRLVVQAPRTPMDLYPNTLWRHLGEINIAGGQRGVGRLGADCWQAVRDSRGRRRGKVFQRYPQSTWGNLNLSTSLLAPGPDGPVATAHFEVLRQGIQECEARIFIEQALADDRLRVRLGPELTRRCRRALDERLLFIHKGLSALQLTGYGYNYAQNWWWTPGVAGHAWYVGSGWQQRSRQLYSLAAEVSARLPTR